MTFILQVIHQAGDKKKNQVMFYYRYQCINIRRRSQRNSSGTPHEVSARPPAPHCPGRHQQLH